MAASAGCAVEHALLHQLREISTLAPLSDDDSRACPDIAGSLRGRARALVEFHRRVWPRAVLLLCRPYLSDPCPRRDLFGCRLRRCGLAVGRVIRLETRRLRVEPTGDLSHDFVRHRAPLPALPLVRR